MQIFEFVGGIAVEVGLEVVGEGNLSAEEALGVQFTGDGLAFFGVVALVGEVPGAVVFADDADVAVEDGFSEEVVGAHIDRGVAAGKVEGTVGDGLDDEGGQVVAAEAEGCLGGLGVCPVAAGVGGDRGFEGVFAEADARWDGPIDGGDAEGGGDGFGAVDEGAVGVGDVDAEVLSGVGVAVAVEQEEPGVDGLAGLVEGLVGGEVEAEVFGDGESGFRGGVQVGESSLDLEFHLFQIRVFGGGKCDGGEALGVGNDALVREWDVGAVGGVVGGGDS